MVVARPALVAVAASRARRQRHRVARPPTLHRGSDRLHRARHLVPEHAGEEPALVGAEVRAADPTGRDPDQQLARPGHGRRQLDHLQTVLLDLGDCPHGYINSISATTRSSAHWTSGSVSTLITAGRPLRKARWRAGRSSSARVTCSAWAPKARA